MVERIKVNRYTDWVDSIEKQYPKKADFSFRSGETYAEVDGIEVATYNETENSGIVLIAEGKKDE